MALLDYQITLILWHLPETLAKAEKDGITNNVCKKMDGAVFMIVVTYEKSIFE